MDILNFTDIMRISWKQAWNIIDHAVERGRSGKINHPSVIGMDEKS
jgi:hypothetical protein